MESKRYFARVPGSKFIFSDGTEGLFAHGRLDINEENFPGDYYVPENNLRSKMNGMKKFIVYQKELDEILGKNPNIFIPPTDPKVSVALEQQPQVAQNALSEAELAATDRVIAGAGMKTRVAQETGPIDPVNLDPNASTIDPSIAAAMLQNVAKQPAVGPGASKIEQLRAQAAASTQSISK